MITRRVLAREWLILLGFVASAVVVSGLSYLILVEDPTETPSLKFETFEDWVAWDVVLKPEVKDSLYQVFGSEATDYSRYRAYKEALLFPENVSVRDPVSRLKEASWIEYVPPHVADSIFGELEGLEVSKSLDARKRDTLYRRCYLSLTGTAETVSEKTIGRVQAKKNLWIVIVYTTFIFAYPFFWFIRSVRWAIQQVRK